MVIVINVIKPKLTETVNKALGLALPYFYSKQESKN